MNENSFFWYNVSQRWRMHSMTVRWARAKIYILFKGKFIGDFPLVILWLLLLLVFDAVCFTTPSGSVFIFLYMDICYGCLVIGIFIVSSAFISNIIFAEQIDKHEQMHMFVYRIEMNCVCTIGKISIWMRRMCAELKTRLARDSQLWHIVRQLWFRVFFSI